MLKNYLLTALRNFRKTKLFSFINVFGLSLGLAAFLLLVLFVKYEKSYDRFHARSDRIYRLRYERTDQDGRAVRFASCCPAAGLRIRTDYPEVEKVARLVRYRAAVSFGEKAFIEERLFFVEADFFSIFSFPFIDGDPRDGLRDSGRAFVSRSTARRYFGDEPPIGRTISLDRKLDFTIVGVFEDVPGNSHIKFDILLSYPDLFRIYPPEDDQTWAHSGWFTYLLFAPGADPAALERKLPALVEAEVGAELRKYNLSGALKLQPLRDIHLASHFQQELEPNGDKQAVNILSLIAAFILLIAWVNYINLSTARSLTRAKEVGLRKVVGATRGRLNVQFFLETVLINLAAAACALALVELALPAFRRLTGLPADVTIWTQAWFWIVLPLLFSASTVLSGIYPVAVLSSFSPAAVIKGKLGNAVRGLSLRKILVVVQFLTAFGLGIGTTAVFRQVAFMRNHDPGFSLNRKIVFRMPRVREPSFSRKLPVFKEEILRHPGVTGFCVTTDVPGRQVWWDAGGIRRAGTNDNKNYQIVGIDEDFVDVFDLKLAAGRNFSRQYQADKTSLILNETAARWLGFSSPQAAVGQQVDYWEEIFTVVGVLKDFHQQSPKQEYEPHIYRYLPEGRDVRGWFVADVEEKALPKALQAVRKFYDGSFPGNPFEYFFLDKYYEQQYAGEKRLGNVLGAFTLLAMIVTCLGVLGLSSFLAAQRTKEIGLRKVLGAGPAGIFFLLTRDSLRLIVLAFLLALPISAAAVRFWLKSFASRMPLTAGLFLLPFGLIVLTAALTVWGHVYKAAKADPVRSLRYE